MLCEKYNLLTMYLFSLTQIETSTYATASQLTVQINLGKKHENINC